MEHKYRDFQLIQILIFLLPLLIFIFLFIFLPILGTFYTSFFQDVSFLNKKFIFLSNYENLIKDSGFWQAFKFNLLFILVSLPLELLLGLIFALVLNIKFPLRGLLRVFLLIPWAIPSAISGRVWQLIYNYNYGLINFLFLKTGIIREPVNWLGSDLGAFIAVVISDVWKTTPFVAIILLAGLQAIPEELYAQAKIDRANFLQIFKRITLPLLKPVIIVALLFRTIDGLRVFDLIYVLTAGGPGGATSSLSFYASKYFLSGDFGYGSCISVCLFLIAFLLSLIYLRISRFTERLL